MSTSIFNAYRRLFGICKFACSFVTGLGGEVTPCNANGFITAHCLRGSPRSGSAIAISAPKRAKDRCSCRGIRCGISLGYHNVVQVQIEPV